MKIRKLIILTLWTFAVSTGLSTLNGGSVEEIRLESPYEFGSNQHKVQLHAHTTDSDGDHAPEWVMKAYAALGYVAVAKTDHDHSDHRANLKDPGGHNITHIPSVEHSGDDNLKSFAHMLGINVKSIYHEEGAGNRPAQIEKINREGGATFLCHPYDESIHRRGWSSEQITQWVKNFTGIEIHNGSSYHDPGGRNYPYKVDLALRSGIETNIIAVDDFHRKPEKTMDRGYVVINSDKAGDSITIEEIVSALKKGNYFAAGRLATDHPVSPYFKEIAVSGNTITVKADKTVDIEFITDRHNYYKGEPYYSQLSRGVTAAQYLATREDRWVRIKLIYTDEKGNHSYAWSNPIYVRRE